MGQLLAREDPAEREQKKHPPLETERLRAGSDEETRLIGLKNAVPPGGPRLPVPATERSEGGEATPALPNRLPHLRQARTRTSPLRPEALALLPRIQAQDLAPPLLTGSGGGIVPAIDLSLCTNLSIQRFRYLCKCKCPWL
jgi:hypothetical protein